MKDELLTPVDQQHAPIVFVMNKQINHLYFDGKARDRDASSHFQVLDQQLRSGEPRHVWLGRSQLVEQLTRRTTQVLQLLSHRVILWLSPVSCLAQARSVQQYSTLHHSSNCRSITTTVCQRVLSVRLGYKFCSCWVTYDKQTQHQSFRAWICTQTLLQTGMRSECSWPHGQAIYQIEDPALKVVEIDNAKFGKIK